MEARLLAYFPGRPGEEIERDVLLREVCGYGPMVVSRSIDNTVRRLRKKIEADPASPVHVLAVHGLGYRFEPVRSVGEEAAAPAATAPGGLGGFFGRGGAAALAGAAALLGDPEDPALRVYRAHVAWALGEGPASFAGEATSAPARVALTVFQGRAVDG